MFQYTKKSRTIETPMEMRAIAAILEGMVKVRYALIPVAKVTARRSAPRNNRFSKFLMF